MRASVLGIMLAGLLVGACDQEFLPAGDDEYVAVVGRSSKTVSPDQANFYVAIRSVEKDVAAAKDDVARKSSLLIKSLIDHGLSTADITTQNFAIGPETQDIEEDGRYYEKELGFFAAYEMEIRTNDPENLGKLVDLITDYSYMIEDFEYSVRDRAALFQEIRNAAIADAETKAQQYATASGRKLGQAVIIEESDANKYRLRPTLRDGYKRGSRGGLDEITVTASKRTSGFTVPFAPPDVTVGLSIYVKFELE